MRFFHSTCRQTHRQTYHTQLRHGVGGLGAHGLRHTTTWLADNQWPRRLCAAAWSSKSRLAARQSLVNAYYTHLTYPQNASLTMKKQSGSDFPLLTREAGHRGKVCTCGPRSQGIDHCSSLPLSPIQFSGNTIDVPVALYSLAPHSCWAKQ